MERDHSHPCVLSVLNDHYYLGELILDACCIVEDVGVRLKQVRRYRLENVLRLHRYELAVVHIPIVDETITAFTKYQQCV